MRIGDKVILNDREGKILSQKWGLFQIQFFDTWETVWVSPSFLKLVESNVI